MHQTHCEYPIDDWEIIGGFPKEGGFFGMGGVDNKRVYATYAQAYNLVKLGNDIMDNKFQAKGFDMFEHFSKPTKVGSDRVMTEFRMERDRGLVKVQLTEASLDNRQGR